jgi:hypothetical protein
VKKFLLAVPFALIAAMFLVACTNKSVASETGNTPIPQNTPDTQTAENILFSDDFSKNSSGWTQLSDNRGAIEYANGYYIITAKKTNTLLIANPGETFSGDVSIEVDARKIDGSDDNYIGVLCHYQNPDNYYMFIVTSDGYSGIAMRKDGLDSLISAGIKFLKMDGIKKGNATNHIRADCIGETLTLYANGKQVNLAYNKSLTGGDTGLAVRSSKLEGITSIRFDNFTVYGSSQP